MSKKSKPITLSEDEEVEVLREGLVAARQVFDEHEEWETPSIILRAMVAADRAIRSAFEDVRSRMPNDRVAWIVPEPVHLIATVLWSKSMGVPIEDCHPYALVTSWAEPLAAAMVAAENIDSALYAMDDDGSGLTGIVNFDAVAALLGPQMEAEGDS